jgi:hypothetical protein
VKIVVSNRTRGGSTSSALVVFRTRPLRPASDRTPSSSVVERAFTTLFCLGFATNLRTYSDNDICRQSGLNRITGGLVYAACNRLELAVNELAEPVNPVSKTARRPATALHWPCSCKTTDTRGSWGPDQRTRRSSKLRRGASIKCPKVSLTYVLNILVSKRTCLDVF